MKLRVDPESRRVRKSRQLIVSWTCIVWLVVIPVTACKETRISGCSIGDSTGMFVCVVAWWNLCASAIVISWSGGCCNSVLILNVDVSPAAYNTTC